ncbi:hypothetical protein [Paraburkholderia ferrariae]|jgi:hypothetical protein|uniref:hypothetical protein n=1 Tax=Paraburkholderia ferrariae TaxID=386056 RepID=UPI0005A81352|nr:hypothetical protein [Paraburkholderia ferrariae]
MTGNDRFIVHDLHAFPLVWSRCRAIVPGYAAQWAHEMDALLARAEPFVIVFEEGQPEETHDDRKTRGLWLKQNKALLGTVCRAVIAIEPDAEKRTALQAQSALASRAFSVAMEVAASSEAALERAREILADAPCSPYAPYSPYAPAPDA